MIRRSAGALITVTGGLLFWLAQAEPVQAGCVGVGCSCSVTATGINFGAYNPLSGADTDGGGMVSVRCSALALGAVISYNVALGAGIGGSMAAREMTSGPDSLVYNLYSDPARTLVWGDGTLGTGRAANAYLLDVLFFRVTDFPVHGRIPGGQNVPAGVYTDSVTATVIF